MTGRFGLYLDPVILERVPSFRGLVVFVDGIENFASDEWSRALLCCAERRIAALPGSPEQHPHMQAWASVYRGFGARPKLYKNGCLALASRERVPAINGLVDLYNAVALSHMLPIGGEDWDRLESHLLRTTALGDEEFVGNEPSSTPERPYPGEPIWLDRAGVTTRRFNWRQARRTRITLATRAAYFVLDAVAPYTPAHLAGAAAELQQLIQQRWPRARSWTLALAPGASSREQLFGAAKPSPALPAASIAHQALRSDPAASAGGVARGPA
ncbi:MAG TPA: phenylalanine--tRNA ligase beta subunit-related protein [Polyangiaceae bacterium]|nr:phenylalanine--tRNA ligase beta subunit-related protein [Polyangiaceae bacterium]